ncbi:hypothetical protein C7H19_00575 [Aphanothece hegewaldii CCALA 016]|uniref:Uncharacterized protein n=1 Tax=Aphanothece hegewaldii CCALA 016 TaxID=2107694 RepID=A0A2T1M3A1_9CHRO|nr:hypothetical protein [Aphanothece hegewaldii]PSF39317.1 hypothetical protein C7H19_00575 [Aphanothece hegewaldii CCALA 016]
MSNDEKSRLDRLEALAEKILEGLAETRHGTDKILEALAETRQRTDSNARSIEALTNEGRIARNRLYEAMTRLAAAQATFWEIQSDYYQHLEQIDERQARMLELLSRLEERL